MITEQRMIYMHLKVGMAQMLVEGGNVEKNLRHANAMIYEGKQKGCDIVVLPECLDLGWTHPAAKTMAEHIPGRTTDAISKAAVENHIHLIAGLTERDGENIFNSAILVSPEGEILLKHRKINVLGIAQDLYSTGDSLRVVKMTVGGTYIKAGLLICADNFPNSLALGHSLARMGAQIILSPCAWAVDSDFDNEKTPYGQSWIDSYTTLARLYDIPVVGVSNVGDIKGGPWDGRICIGNSIAVDSGGDVAAIAPHGRDAEILIVVELEVTSHGVTGTNLASMLRMGGYEGP